MNFQSWVYSLHRLVNNKRNQRFTHSWKDLRTKNLWKPFLVHTYNLIYPPMVRINPNSKKKKVGVSVLNMAPLHLKFTHNSWRLQTRSMKTTKKIYSSLWACIKDVNRKFGNIFHGVNLPPSSSILLQCVFRGIPIHSLTGHQPWEGTALFSWRNKTMLNAYFTKDLRTAVKVFTHNCCMKTLVIHKPGHT